MIATIESLIEARADLSATSFTARELAELVITGKPGEYRISLGYSIYSYNGLFWRPIITLRHTFQSRERAERVVEDILCSVSLDLSHWESPSDPNQDELKF